MSAAGGGPTGAVRTALRLDGEREYREGLARAERAARESAQRASAMQSAIDRERAAAQRRVSAASQRMVQEQADLERRAAATRASEERAQAEAAQRVTARNQMIMGAAAAGAAALVVVAREASEALYDLGMRGGEVSAVATAFERIADPATLDQMREATGGLVADIDLMRLSTQALRVGLVEQNELAEWFAVATRAAQDTGRDIPQAMQAVTTALSGGGTEALAQLGVNITSIKDELREMGLSAESEAGRVEFLRLAMGQLGDDLGDVDNASSNLNDAWTRLGNVLGNWYDELARSFSENDRLVAFFGHLNDDLEDGRPRAEALGDALADLFADGLEGARDLAEEMRPTTEAIADIGELLGGIRTAADIAGAAGRGMLENLPGVQNVLPVARLVGSFVDLGREVVNATGATEDLAPAVDMSAEAAARAGMSYSAYVQQVIDAEIETRAWEQTLRDLAAAMEETDPFSEESRAAGEAAARRRGRRYQDAPEPRRRGGGGARGEDPEEAALERQAALLAEILGPLEAQEEMRRTLLEIANEQADAERAHIALLQEVEQKRVDLAAQEAVARQALADARAAEVEAEREAADARIGQYERVIGATRAAAQGTQSIFSSVMQLMDATGKSAEEQAEAEGKFLIGYSIVMAAIEAAEMIAAIAKQRYDQAISHGLAVVAYGLAAGTAAARLGGGSAGSVPSAGTVVQRREPQVEDRDVGPGGMTIVNQYSLGRTNAEAGLAIQRLSWESERHSSRQDPAPGVGYAG